MHSSNDTIAAIATPPGFGGIGIVRISGADVPQIAKTLLGALPAPRQAGLHTLHDSAGNTIDRGIVLYFPAPHSFTGEHVLELQAHGGPVVLDLLLAHILQLGARPARPGEFSERAYLNDKLDLAQAEAIADLIESGTAQAARAAGRSLEGQFSSAVQGLLEQLTGLRVYVEAALDFPDEEIDFLADRHVTDRLESIERDCTALLASARQGCLLRDGLTLVIAGRPNAGKSSLLNALAGRDSAIVTEIPGTTRDLLREQVQLDGLPLHLVDTAGLHDSADPVEMAGMQRAREAIDVADRILLVIDDSSAAAAEPVPADLPAGIERLHVYNKIDRSGRAAGPFDDDGVPAVAISVKTGAGMDALAEVLKLAAGYAGPAEGGFSARRRHLDALHRTHACVTAGQQCLAEQRAGELLAEELRSAQHQLGEITGAFSSEDLLDRIFSGFCIGK